MIWDDYAKAYALLMEHNSLYTAMRDKIHKFSEGFGSVLDAGCGPGLILKAIPVKKKFGVDVSAEMIAFAARTVDAALQTCDAHTYPLSKVDLTVCSNVVYTSPNPGALIANISRATQSRIIITNPKPNANNRKLAEIVLGEFAAKGLLEKYPREIDVFVRCNTQQISTMVYSALDEDGLCALLDQEKFGVTHREPIFANEGYLLVADRR